MDNNYIEKFMNENNISINEHFMITNTLGSYYIDNRFKLHCEKTNRCYHDILVDLLSGRRKIVPMFPQLNKQYFYIRFGYIVKGKSFKSSITNKAWQDTSFDRANEGVGNCFKSFSEAHGKFLKYVKKLNDIKFKIWEEV